MDDDVDIYGDLPSFNVNECSKCKERAGEFAEKYARLEKEISLWKGKCENFEEEKKTILTNSSSLMKTARAEVNRKDRIIIELRRELEDVKFRRGVWSKSKSNPHNRHQYNRYQHESRENTSQKGTMRYEKELSIESVQTHSTADQPAARTQFNVDEEDPEQKWDPECKNFTVYGERLRKKLLQEQEVERIQKEEAKTSESKNSALLHGQETKRIPKEEKDEITKSKSSALSQEQETERIQKEGTKTFESKNSALLHGQETKRIPKEEKDKISQSKSSALSREQETEKIQKEAAKTSEFKSSALLQEQELGKIQQEEAKSSALCFNRTQKLVDRKDDLLSVIKVKEETQLKKESKSVPSDGMQLTKVEEERHDAIDSSVKQEYQIDEHHEESSEEGELSDSSELQSENENRYCKGDGQMDGRYETSPNRWSEINHGEDSNNRNSNVNHDLRYNLLHKSRNRSKNFGYPDQTSRRHGESEPTRRNHDPRSRSNHKYQKVNTMNRKEKHRVHSEKYEKCREDRLTRDKYNYADYNSKDNHDLRDRCELKYDDHDINYDSDNRRPAKSRSPGGHSRSKSNSSRSSQNDRRRTERSKSRGRLNIDDNIVSDKDRTDEKGKSRDRRILGKEYANNDSQAIHSVKESSSRNFADNIKTSEGSRMMNHDESRDKSKRSSSHNNEKRPTERPKSHERLEIENKKESKTEQKEGSRNREIVNGVRDNDYSEIVKPIAESSRRNSLENVVPSTNSKELGQTNSNEAPEKASDNSKVQTVTSEKVPAPIDTRDKFILMLENDSEVALSPIIGQEIESIGSRSFREEKIENIEKFIQDYQYDATHCSLLGTDNRSEQEEENKFANSTSSIVDTLSMDVDDVPKELEPKITKISKSSEESTVTEKSEEKNIDKKLKVDVVDEKKESLTTVSKVDNSREKPTAVSLGKKSKDIAINEKFDKVIVNEKNKSSSIDKAPETGAVEKEKADIIEKLEKTTIERKKEEIVSDKLEDCEIDRKKSETTSIDKKTKRGASQKKLHHIGGDGKPREAAINLDEKASRKLHKKLEKVDSDKQLKINELIDSVTGNKESSKKPDDSKFEKKLKNSNISEKINDATIDCKHEQVFVDKKLKNVSPVKTCEKTLESVLKNTESVDAAVDKNSEKTELFKRTEVKESDKLIDKISPPLPPSPQLLPLPPLPPSPPPEEKEPELTIVPTKFPPVKEEIKKLQTEKVIPKQTKNRPRIPCLPIVSLYYRKRRGMVLTDSTSSHTIVSSMRPTRTVETAKENVDSAQETSEIGSKSDSAPIKVTKLSLSNEARSKNPTDRSIMPETSDKTAPTKLVEAQNIVTLKKADKIITKPENSSLDRDKPEVDFSSNVAATSNKDKKFKNESPVGSSLKEKNIDAEIARGTEDKAEQVQPEVDPTKNSQSKNSDEIHTNGTSSKFTERAKRSVLKTIASTTTSTESGSSSRKRPLSKEKENQSKPSKQAKIMVIKRRRPVQLEDSSTVTTLVASEHNESYKDNKIQSLGKNATSVRKRRAVES